MSRIVQAAGLVLLGLSLSLLLTGCGGGSLTSDPGTPPPHEGQLVMIPGGKGFVEVVKREPSTPKAPLSGEATFYFLKDPKTPYSPAPSSGVLTVGKKKVTLQSSGEGLATPNGPALFPKGGMDGVLTIQLDGQDVNIPLGVR
jgi:hypothetical protein